MVDGRSSAQAVSVFFLEVGEHVVPNEKIVEPVPHQSRVTNLKDLGGAVVWLFVVHQSTLARLGGAIFQLLIGQE